MEKVPYLPIESVGDPLNEPNIEFNSQENFVLDTVDPPEDSASYTRTQANAARMEELELMCGNLADALESTKKELEMVRMNDLSVVYDFN